MVHHRYRKIPGDKCEGGKNPERKVIDMSTKCISNLLDPQLQVRIQTDTDQKYHEGNGGSK